MYNYCAIIPSLDPDERIFSIVEKLKNNGFEKIIAVNDGSSSDEIFVRLRDEYGCTVLTHYINLGKGRGMKTALNYYMNNFSGECDGVVFADSDDQHDIDDICACCDCLFRHPDSLVLGVRDFSDPKVPPRSRFGNRTTSRFFRLFCGLNISDTQTGLRAMGNEIIPHFIGLGGERFDYETNMLLETKALNIPIKEVPIKTIYIEDNKQSHFNPIKDSIAIYKMLIGYVSSSLAAAVIDLVLYQLLFVLLGGLAGNLRIACSTAGARIVSSLFNYTVNSKAVFRSAENPRRTIVKYYILCILQAAASYGGVYGLSLVFGQEHTLWMKIIVDTVLFLLSFKIQQNWVFGGKSKKG
ncbi:MAG: GtrA family protein [Oscillospiraceae bacterium]